MPKYTTVDRFTKDTIRAFLQELSIITGRKPNPKEEFGHGPLIWAGEAVLQWAEEQEYKFYNPRNVPITPKLMGLRIKTYVNGDSIFSASAKDARWIAQQMRQRMPSPELTKRATTVEDVAQVTHAYVEPEPIAADIPPTMTDLDKIRDLAWSFRDFANGSTDTELVTIMADTELKLLRLLADRL